jgi:hypothetical protein
MAPPITAGNVDQVKSSYQEHYDLLRKDGFSRDQARAEAQRLVIYEYEGVEVEEMLNASLPKYLGEYNSPGHIKYRKTILISSLEGIPVVKEAGGWYTLPLEKQNSVLYALGMSVHRAGWWMEYRPIRVGSKVVTTNYILSEERSDKAWLNKIVGGYNVASEEVRVKSANDPSLEQELEKLGGPRLGN